LTKRKQEPLPKHATKSHNENFEPQPQIFTQTQMELPENYFESTKENFTGLISFNDSENFAQSKRAPQRIGGKKLFD
jgi:hypothetical protein